MRILACGCKKVVTQAGTLKHQSAQYLPAERRQPKARTFTSFVQEVMPQTVGAGNSG
jgi:hypothetical protein